MSDFKHQINRRKKASRIVHECVGILNKINRDLNALTLPEEVQSIPPSIDKEETINSELRKTEIEEHAEESVNVHPEVPSTCIKKRDKEFQMELKQSAEHFIQFQKERLVKKNQLKQFYAAAAEMAAGKQAKQGEQSAESPIETQKNMFLVRNLLEATGESRNQHFGFISSSVTSSANQRMVNLGFSVGKCIGGVDGKLCMVFTNGISF
jgi:hypothetical protein